MGVQGIAPANTKKVTLRWFNSDGYPNIVYAKQNNLYSTLKQNIDDNYADINSSLAKEITNLVFTNDQRWYNGNLTTLSENSRVAADVNYYPVKQGDFFLITNIHKSRYYSYDIISFFDTNKAFISSKNISSGSVSDSLDDVSIFAPADGYVTFCSVYNEDNYPVFSAKTKLAQIYSTLKQDIDNNYTELGVKQLLKINGLTFVENLRLNSDGTTSELSANSNVYCDETYYPVKKGDIFYVENLTPSRYNRVNPFVFYNTEKQVVDTDLQYELMGYEYTEGKEIYLTNTPYTVAKQDGFVRFGKGNNDTYSQENTIFYRNSPIKDEIEKIWNQWPAIDTIAINGDSTAQGLAKYFSSELINGERAIQTINPGPVGSENVRATAARQGGIPCIVMPFTIPAEVTTIATSENIGEPNLDPVVKITSSILFHQTYNTDGTPETPSIQDNSDMSFVGLNNAWFYCYINGVYGRLYTVGGYRYDESGELVVDDSAKTHFFHRETAGDRIAITKPTEVVPADAELWKNCITINLMGTNGGFNNYGDDYITIGSGNTSRERVSDSQAAKNLFDIQKRMSAYSVGKYLIIGYFQPTIITKEFYEEYESLCEHEFGQYFFNARLYLKDYAWTELNITLTEDDKTNMQAGRPPLSLFDSPASPHLTDIAKKALCNQVAIRIHELGWLKRYPKLWDLSKN